MPPLRTKKFLMQYTPESGAPESISFDRLQRFKTSEDVNGEKSGWYLAFSNDEILAVVLFGFDLEKVAIQ